MSQQVERHLAIKKPGFQRTDIQQLGGLTCQLADAFTPQCRYRQTRRYRHRLDIDQAAQRRQSQGNRSGRSTGAGNQTGSDATAVQKRSIYFRHHIRRLG